MRQKPLSDKKQLFFCLSCPDVLAIPAPGGKTRYYCTLRKKWLRIGKQRKTRLLDCPHRKRYDGPGRPKQEPTPQGFIDCVWCGRRIKTELRIQVIGEPNRNYCSMKCLGEYLWTRKYDHNGNIIPRKK